MTRRVGLLATIAALMSTPLKAQGPKVGDLAPDFAVTAATKAGVRPTPIRLSDFRGQVVVLAFFPKARTGG